MKQVSAVAGKLGKISSSVNRTNVRNIDILYCPIHVVPIKQWTDKNWEASTTPGFKVFHT